jgi:hypothetical protein
LPRISSYLATSIDRGLKLLPAGAGVTILAVTKTSFDAALRLALSSLGEGQTQASRPNHKAGVGSSSVYCIAIGMPTS